MPFSQGMNEQTWYFYTTGYYSETQANDLLMHTAPWMELKCLVLHGSNWTGQLHSPMVQKLLLTLYTREAHSTEDRSVCPGAGKMGRRFQEGLGTD